MRYIQLFIDHHGMTLTVLKNSQNSFSIFNTKSNINMIKCINAKITEL